MFVAVTETVETLETVSVVRTVSVEEIPDPSPPPVAKPAPQSFAVEIAMGVAMLTAYFRGLHWVDRIDASKLNVACIENCILGQVFGSYWKAPKELIAENNINYLDGAPDRFGFRATGFYEDITEQWKPVILGLQAERAKVKGKRKYKPQAQPQT